MATLRLDAQITELLSSGSRIEFQVYFKLRYSTTRIFTLVRPHPNRTVPVRVVCRVFGSALLITQTIDSFCIIKKLILTLRADEMRLSAV